MTKNDPVMGMLTGIRVNWGREKRPECLIVPDIDSEFGKSKNF